MKVVAVGAAICANSNILPPGSVPLDSRDADVSVEAVQERLICVAKQSGRRQVCLVRWVECDRRCHRTKS